MTSSPEKKTGRTGFPSAFFSGNGGCFGVLAIIAIATVTFFVFSPSLSNGFTNWDDDRLVLENYDIREFSKRNLTAILSKSYLNHYAPITMLSFMAEYSLFGTHPLPYHATNLLLHILNASLVFVLVSALSGKRRVALLTALLFAVHPLRVESVAWIAERKGLLSACFYFSSLLMFVRYRSAGRGGWYVGSLLAFAAALLSKSMAMSLPFVLLLLDHVQGRRIDRKSLLEKTPFFLFAMACGIIAIIGAHDSADHHSVTLVGRIMSPLMAIIFYVYKTVVPVHLCALYDGGGMSGWAAPTGMIILLALIVLVIHSRFDPKKKIFGSVFFLITLVPALQIVSSGGWTNLADRYSYLPQLGLLYLFAEMAADAHRRSGVPAQRMLVAGIAAVVLCCMVLTSRQCVVWRNSLSLWNDAISKCPGAVAYCNRGIAWKSAGEIEKAIEDLDRSIRIDSSYAFSYGNRGELFIRQGDLESALDDLTRAISLDPRYANAYRNRGSIYLYRGEYDRALSDFEQDIRLNPWHAGSYYNRGLAYSLKNDFKRAVADYTQAIALDSTCSRAYFNRGIVFQKIGDGERERNDLKKACALGFTQACDALIENRAEESYQ
ncbi:MAG: tetratricopeptide repeat protein [Chitinispirillaceae bacterium]|nr:tetratricopeptide repeat protein [Chitinispirillaceae bacterium]